jgi:hypothetical protein
MRVRVADSIAPTCNFYANLRERGKLVPGSHREGHNVFTTTGRDWLAHLVAWQTIGTPDIPFTNRRIRWMGVGSGEQLELESVDGLNDPVLCTPAAYLAAIQVVQFPALKTTQIFKSFSENEISFPPNTVVPITEAGMFVDVYPASSLGGTEDSNVGVFDTTLNPNVSVNSPIAYHTFEVINKTADFSLEIRWELRF